VGRIDAPTGEIASVGAGVAAVGPSMAAVAGPLRAAGGISDPPATAAALEDLASQWSTAADRLGDELTALGQAAQASAYAYATTDERQMIASPRP
jgi:hypothetical protein